jgi:hypothetical protein
VVPTEINCVVKTMYNFIFIWICDYRWLRTVGVSCSLNVLTVGHRTIVWGSKFQWIQSVYNSEQNLLCFTRLFTIYTNNNIVAVPTTILIPTDPRIRQFHPFTYWYRHLHANKSILACQDSSTIYHGNIETFKVLLSS